LLGYGGLVVAGLVVYLFIEVRAEPSVEVDEARLARARSEAASRARSARPTPSPSTGGSISSNARVVRPGEKQDSPAPQPRQPPVAVAGMTANLDTSIPDLADAKTFTDKVKVARRLYGRRRYEQAFELAVQLLEEEPNNRRVLRVVIASACIMANPTDAEKYYQRLKMARDRKQMQRRCNAYGVEIPE
jgi:hypothetical protein